MQVERSEIETYSPFKDDLFDSFGDEEMEKVSTSGVHVYVTLLWCL